MLTEVELAWLSGLFEGEGCIGLNHGRYPVLILSMTDEDVVRRVHAIAGVGHIYKRPRTCKSGKQLWAWSVGRCDEAAALLRKMLPLLGARRTARAHKVLAAYAAAPVPKRLRTHCKYGHEFTPENTAWDKTRGFNARRCRKCSVRRTQEHLARKRAA